MRRRTKIIATLGPASATPQTITTLIEVGVDLFRINFSHGTPEEHRQWTEWIRHISHQLERTVGILGDLQGPKIRIGKFKTGSVTLQDGTQFVLNATLDENAGTEHQVGLVYKDLPKQVKKNDVLLLSDGRLELVVNQVHENEIICTVQSGGELAAHQGINLKGGGLSAPALTPADLGNIRLATELELDYLALSFPRNGADVKKARYLMHQAHCPSALITKIERAEALHDLDAMILASDGVMVARGDLGVEIGDAELPAVQKRIIALAGNLNRLVITATQMMESMIENTIPTRAEVFDVANAVLEGTDAVMLSAETATGKHPIKVVEAVHRICLGAEKQRATQISSHRLDRKFEHIDEAIAMAVMYTANHSLIKAIVTFTESAATPLWMSRINSPIPIFGFTRHPATARKMTLYRDVIPVHSDFTNYTAPQLAETATTELLKRQVVQPGDWVILTRGDMVGSHGGTNRMKIMRIGDEIKM